MSPFGKADKSLSLKREHSVCAAPDAIASQAFMPHIPYPQLVFLSAASWSGFPKLVWDIG